MQVLRKIAHTAYSLSAVSQVTSRILDRLSGRYPRVCAPKDSVVLLPHSDPYYSAAYVSASGVLAWRFYALSALITSTSTPFELVLAGRATFVSEHWG